MNEEQKRFIEDNYSSMDTKIISEKLNISVSKIYKFATRNGLKKDNPSKFYNIEQFNFVIENYAIMSNSEIMKKTGLKINTIKSISTRYKLKKSKIFKDNSNFNYNQIKFIMKNCEKMTSSEIASILKCEAFKISLFCKSNGLNLKEHDGLVNSGKLTLEQKRFIKDNYKNMTNEDICKKLGIDQKSLHSYSSSLNLIKDPYYRKNKNGYFDVLMQKRKREYYDINNYIDNSKEIKVDKELLYKPKYGKYRVNQDYFNVIDNEFKAYWLGFLYADGCIRKKKTSNGKEDNKLSLTLASIDREHIERFLISLQSDSPITDYIIKDKYNASRVSVCNKKIVENLSDKGCTQNKSLTLEFPSMEILPKHLIRDFIRGYFDGDGCIHLDLEKRNLSVNFVGTENFLTSMQNILCEELKITKTKLYKKENTKAFQVAWGDLSSIEKIYKYLYKDCNIYLKRKLEKFDILFCLD